MSSSIDELQKRIAELQVAGGLVPKQPVPAVNDSPSDIKSLIRDVIREEMSLLKDSTLVKPEPPVVPARELTMLEAIGQCLTVEEQKWLSKPDILQQVDKKLATYFQTEEGKSAVKTFFTYFRGFYEN
jgi:hypothetical protein